MAKIRDLDQQPAINDTLIIRRRRRIPVLRYKNADGRMKNGTMLFDEGENISIVSLGGGNGNDVFVAINTGSAQRPLALLAKNVFENLHADLLSRSAAR